MKLKVSKITVLKREGSDLCIVEFENEILEGIWPFENNLKMKFEVSKSKGLDYVNLNFPGIDVEVIDTREGCNE